MKVIPQINLDDYRYELSADKIADYPLKERSASKLLVCRNDKIIHEKFKNVSTYLPAQTLLIFNDTKVIPARIHLYKVSGARIEIFLLEPLVPSTQERVMTETKTCTWECMIGNAKKWPVDSKLTCTLNNFELVATRINASEVRFTWTGGLSFSEVLQELGKVPLPPYIKRQSEDSDTERYQTVYSRLEGAVAAPTAGLHFSDEIMQELATKGISSDFVTLHVSAGTFQPVKEDNAVDHPMHREMVLVNRSTVERLLYAPQIGAVGTTSLRTLESLYWFGVMLESDPSVLFNISKLFPYENESNLTRAKAMENVLTYMNQRGLEVLEGYTEIYIFPGYQFRMVSSLITNFHMPGSTLILLIAAFLGGNRWRDVYEGALQEDYRFLSYGDSSLLIGKEV